MFFIRIKYLKFAFIYLLMKEDIVKLSKELMQDSTKKNGAPPWSLTEIAISKAIELSEECNLTEHEKELVLTSLYLSHIVFTDKFEGESAKIRRQHPNLSAELAEKYLNKWGVSEDDSFIILNAIRSHHAGTEMKSKVAEVMRNAECFKFVTLKGSLIWFHELGRRGRSYEDSVDKVINKMEQKRNLLTFPSSIKEAENNCIRIREIFDSKLN
jgi:hypothetical protein